MIFAELNKLDTSPKALRKFGLTVGGVFLLLAAWTVYRHKWFYGWFLAPGALLALLGAVWPRLLRGVYWVWMGLALALGAVAASILLTLLFYLILTPIGLVARVAGKDFLRQRRAPEQASYWLERPSRPAEKADYERQY